MGYFNNEIAIDIQNQNLEDDPFAEVNPQEER